MVATLLGGALAAGGANAINMFVDRDIDKLMHRTRKRPLVTGAITPRNALVFAITLEVAGLRRAVGVGQPALGGPGRLGHPVLRVRVHAVAEADQQPEHRHRRGRRGGAGAGGLGGGDRQPVVDAGGHVRHHLRLDAAPLLGPGRQVQGRLPGGQRAHAAGGGHLQADGPGDPRLQRDPGGGVAAPGRRGHLGVVYIVAAAVLGVVFVALAAGLWRRATPKAAMQLFSYSITYLTLLFVVMAVDIFIKHLSDVVALPRRRPRSPARTALPPAARARLRARRHGSRVHAPPGARDACGR